METKCKCEGRGWVVAGIVDGCNVIQKCDDCNKIKTDSEARKIGVDQIMADDSLLNLKTQYQGRKLQAPPKSW